VVNLKLRDDQKRPMRKDCRGFYFIIGLSLSCTLFFLLSLILVSAHSDGGSAGVIVRVVEYDPVTYQYNLTCKIPDATPASQVDPRRFYAIDPIPQGAAEFFRSYDEKFTWNLDPLNYDELVHTQAMYHLYCEVQNYSAPAGKQNLASEFHVDLRDTHNQNVPNIYVLWSEGPTVTLKCDPPPATKNFDIFWALRNREGRTNYPGLKNQRIVNITVSKPEAGYDVVCDVFDRDLGKTFHWDMPLEFFNEGPAYVPTIEGCVHDDLCYQVSPDGIVPNGTLIINVTNNESQPLMGDVYINEIFKGKTNINGFFTIQNIIPGIYNLVVRNTPYEELSTLIPIKTGKTLYRNYTLGNQTSSSSPKVFGNGTCVSSVISLQAACIGGTFTQDVKGGSCRTLVCGQKASGLQVLACNKPDGKNSKFFEMYKQSGNPAGLEICLGQTCISKNGYIRSPEFPICFDEEVSEPATGSLKVNSIPNLVNFFINGISSGQTSFSGELNIHNLSPGSYNVKSNKEGYFNKSEQVSVTAGLTTDYSVNLSPIQNKNSTENEIIYNATLTITKIVINDNNGTMNFNQFQLLLNGSSITSGIPIIIQPGSYLVSEVTNENYTSSYSGNCTDNGMITLSQNDSKSCIVTNDDILINETNYTENTSKEDNLSESNLTQCFSDVNDMVPTCNGGTISKDSSSGACRTLICGDGTGSLKVFSCNKPDGKIPVFFEMYRQSANNAGIEICLGGECMKNMGYSKSKNFPICVTTKYAGANNTNDSAITPEPSGEAQNASINITTNPIDSNVYINNALRGITDLLGNLLIQNLAAGNYNLKVSKINHTDYIQSVSLSEGMNLSLNITLQHVQVEACHNNVQSFPLSCDGGIISAFSSGGSCRTFTCTNKEDSMRILACNKPDSVTPKYFEMYKQLHIGPTQFEMCIGQTCIRDRGYQKSEEFPICN
jgi:hypothetical protein